VNDGPGGALQALVGALEQVGAALYQMLFRRAAALSDRNTTLLIAPMPLANASALSAPSSRATASSNDDTVGFAYRP